MLLEWLDDGGDFCMSDETKDSFCSTASLLTNNNNHVHSTAIPCLVWYMDGLCVSNDLISLEDGKVLQSHALFSSHEEKDVLS